MWRCVVSFASAMVSLTLSLPGQAGNGDLTDVNLESSYRLRVRADWIYVNASVWDPQKRESVVDLGKEDFLLYEDGEIRSIDACLSREAPFHLLLLLDVSGSTSGFIQLIREAAGKFTDQLKPDDRIAILTFHSETSVIQSFTSNRQSAKVAIEQIRSEGSTALYDAVLTALDMMRGIEGRKAVIIFSDGADNQLVDPMKGSEATFEEVRHVVRETDCLIYTILLLPFKPDRRRDKVLYKAQTQLELLAEETGGRSLRPRKPRDLEEAYSEIASDLRHVYTLTFTPGIPRIAGWHDLRVEVKGREGLTTRSRRGYFSSSEEARAE